MTSLINKFNPAVRKPVLVLISGIVWLGTGIMLVSLAYGWLYDYDGKYVYLYALAGLAASIIISRFGFNKIVDKNLKRIKAIKGLYCAFGFMPWKSYFLIMIMMTMGLLLKKSALPKEYLAILYISIGMALALSSIRYFKSVRDKKNNKV